MNVVVEWNIVAFSLSASVTSELLLVEMFICYYNVSDRLSQVYFYYSIKCDAFLGRAVEQKKIRLAESSCVSSLVPFSSAFE